MIDSIKKILFTGSLKGQYLSELIRDISDTLIDENIELIGIACDLIGQRGGQLKHRTRPVAGLGQR